MGNFGELEATIMNVIWSANEPRSVRDVLEAIQGERPVAYTTVMTVMERLFRKKLLSREQLGKAFLYSPVLSRADYKAGLMAEALADGGDRAATLVHFVERMGAREAEHLLNALSARPIAGVVESRDGSSRTADLRRGC